jgi:hypothetical protein
MRPVLVTVIVVAAITGFAGSLEDLQAASVRYVTAMKAILAISDDTDCPELVAKGVDYAVLKMQEQVKGDRALIRSGGRVFYGKSRTVRLSAAERQRRSDKMQD